MGGAGGGWARGEGGQKAQTARYQVSESRAAVCPAWRRSNTGLHGRTLLREAILSGLITRKHRPTGVWWQMVTRRTAATISP